MDGIEKAKANGNEVLKAFFRSKEGEDQLKQLRDYMDYQILKTIENLEHSAEQNDSRSAHGDQKTK